MKKISYITHDSWWNSDIPLFEKINEFFRIDVFVFSSRKRNKVFKTKSSVYVDSIREYERPYALKNPLSFFSALKFIFGILKNSSKTDVFFYVFGDDPYFNLLFLVLVSSKKAIISFHNFESHSDSPLYEKVLKKIILRRYRNFHFQSELQYRLFLKRFPKKEAFFNHMPIKDFGKPKNNISIRRPNVRNLLFFGYVRDYKKLDVFIKSANEIVQDIHFIIAGNCDEWEEYEKLIADPSKFTCHIKVIDNADIPDYFSQSDFIVLPYSDTTQSGPLLIAYAYNLPIIASDLEMFKIMVKNNENGYLFARNDIDDLATIINKVIHMSEDEYKHMKDCQTFYKDEYIKACNNIGVKFSEFISKNLIDTNAL